MHRQEKSKPTIIAIVQGRMGSTRLPGKVLMDIEGKPMLWHIVERLKYSKFIDKVIIATGDNEENMPIVNFAKENKLLHYAGEEKDLVDRFFQASKLFSGDVIVRITADCPLVDPVVVDKVIDFFLKNMDKYVYVSNSRPVHTYPHGLDVEVLSFSLLKKIWHETTDPFRREWFTTVIFENPNEYSQFCVKNDKDLSDMRLTVDYPEDMELVRYIFKNLYSDHACFSLSDILDLFLKDTEIFNANNKYKRDEAYIQELTKRGLK